MVANGAEAPGLVLPQVEVDTSLPDKSATISSEVRTGAIMLPPFTAPLPLFQVPVPAARPLRHADAGQAVLLLGGRRTSQKTRGPSYLWCPKPTQV